MYTVSSQIINQTLGAIKEEGVNIRPICEQIGIDMSLLKDADARYTIDQENKLWDALIAQGCGEDVGLRVGKKFQPTYLSTVAYVMMYAPNLAIALKKCGTYQELLCDVTLMHLDEGKGMWEIELQGPWYDPYRYLVDKLLVIFASSSQSLCCEEIFPKEVHFPYAKPADLPYRQYFPHSDLRFNQKNAALVFHPKDLQTTIPFADTKLYHIFDQHAQELMQKLGRGASIVQQVNKKLIETIRADTPSLELIADELAMSPRNLQVKLKEAGTSYQAMLDDIRKEMAISYLQKGELSKSDIAFLLGFSGLSTFSHRFKKWTGYSPSAWMQAKAG